MHTAHPARAHRSRNLCLQLFNLNSFRPTGPELPRGSSCSVSKSSEWTTTPLNGIKAASFVFIKQENESSTNPHVGPLKMQVKTARFSKFCPIKENSEGILMMLWVMVSSEVVHLLLWFDNPWVRTHRLREKQNLARNFCYTPYIYMDVFICIYIDYIDIYIYIYF